MSQKRKAEASLDNVRGAAPQKNSKNLSRQEVVDKVKQY
jgi:hypothetical protein